jgi:4-carboxymuconolactone decarboxylase
MTRLDAAAGGGEVREQILARRGGTLRPLDDVLLHSPPVAQGWNVFLGAIRGATSIPADTRELIVLRIAVLNDAEYEWWAHAADAVKAGVNPAQLEAVRTDPEDPAFSEQQRAALVFASCMTQNIVVPDEIFNRLRGLFEDRQIVEITATAATYNMVSRFLVALEVRAPVATDDGGGA